MKVEFKDIQISDKNFFIGCDEVGYGCLAGPLTVCGVMAPKTWALDGLNDSKKLSPKRREEMRTKLKTAADNGDIKYYIAERSSADIDKFGVSSMLKSAYIECFTSFSQAKETLIITDGILKFDNLDVDDYNIVSLIKADTLVPSVMAASILAKTHRDALMKTFHKSYPQYNWESNVGYGSPDHLKAMRQFGLSPLHRRSYKVKTLLDLYE